MNVHSALLQLLKKGRNICSSKRDWPHEKAQWPKRPLNGYETLNTHGKPKEKKVKPIKVIEPEPEKPIRVGFAALGLPEIEIQSERQLRWRLRKSKKCPIEHSESFKRTGNLEADKQALTEQVWEWLMGEGATHEFILGKLIAAKLK